MRNFPVRIFIVLFLFSLAARAANVDVQVETVHAEQGSSSYLRLLCSTDIALASVRTPLQVDNNTDVVLDSVSFAYSVAKPAAWFKYQSQITNSNRRGFINILPNVSYGVQTFPAPGGELARIYFHVLPSASLAFVLVDSFMVGYDQLDVSDELGNTIYPTFTFGGIWIDQKAAVEGDGTLPLPARFDLMQNYPNPFNPSTRIEFELSRSSWISLELFDLLGERVEILADARFSAGKHSVEWNAGVYPSGVYFYRLKTPEGIISRKMILLK